MVTRRARTMFGLCLAFALLPLLSMAAGEDHARADTAMSWVQFQAKSESSAQPSRALAATDAHHPPFTPFAPAALFSLPLSARAPANAAVASHAFAGGAPVARQARAPPALP